MTLDKGPRSGIGIEEFHQGLKDLLDGRLHQIQLGRTSSLELSSAAKVLSTTTSSMIATAAKIEAQAAAP